MSLEAGHDESDDFEVQDDSGSDCNDLKKGQDLDRWLQDSFKEEPESGNCIVVSLDFWPQFWLKIIVVWLVLIVS